MKTELHRSETRGHANHGWLDAHHTFSFAGYFDPSRVHFGMLRVLNDDRVEGGKGFGMHPHDNMEIVTIPLEGALEHKDSMGNSSVIYAGDVQVMSAGTGVYHSEFNHYPDKVVKLLQIWVFPNEKGVKPRYDQKTFSPGDRTNKFQAVVAPSAEGAMFIHQNAVFSLASIEKGKSASYSLSYNGNGVYAFVISGKVTIGEHSLNTRDGMGISEANSFEVNAEEEAEVLLIEVPMN
jgi:redox-sensitive bicupin YhaK (pirin superfamily)